MVMVPRDEKLVLMRLRGEPLQSVVDLFGLAGLCEITGMNENVAVW